MSHHLKSETGLKRWWQLLRPHTLTASFIPVTFGTLLANLVTSIHITLYLAMLIAAILIQAATNMFNEYYDYIRGLDNAQSVGIGGAIVRNHITPKQVLTLALIFYFISLLLGLYIASQTTWYLLALGLICMLVGYLYTGGPYPISSTPFGELFAGLFMGIIIIGISFYIQTGFLSLTIIYYALPSSLLIANILMANNIRDLDNDKLNHRRTLAILIGKKNAIYYLIISFILSYIIVFVLSIQTGGSLFYNLTLLSLPIAIKSIQLFKKGQTNIEMMPAMGAVAKFNTIFGALFCIALLTQAILLKA